MTHDAVGNRVATGTRTRVFDARGRLARTALSRVDERNAPDWTDLSEETTESGWETEGALLLESAAYMSTATFDALDRPVTMTAPADSGRPASTHLSSSPHEWVLPTAASGEADRTFYVYDATGNRVRKVSEQRTNSESPWVRVADTVYLDGFELSRKWMGAGGDDLDEEIETVHLMDGESRIALIETQTVEDEDPVTTPTPKWRFQLDDRLGSACIEIARDGTVISYEEYHAYGSTALHIADASFSPRRYRWSAKERDPESGLVYFGTRYLAPWMGRWVSADPAGAVDGNAYRVVRGNPVSLRELDGRQSYGPTENETGTMPEGSGVNAERSGSQTPPHTVPLSVDSSAIDSPSGMTPSAGSTAGGGLIFAGSLQRPAQGEPDIHEAERRALERLVRPAVRAAQSAGLPSTSTIIFINDWDELGEAGEVVSDLLQSRGLGDKNIDEVLEPITRGSIEGFTIQDTDFSVMTAHATLSPGVGGSYLLSRSGREILVDELGHQYTNMSSLTLTDEDLHGVTPVFMAFARGVVANDPDFEGQALSLALMQRPRGDDDAVRDTVRSAGAGLNSLPRSGAAVMQTEFWSLMFSELQRAANESQR